MQNSRAEGALNHVVVHPLGPVDGEIVAAARVAMGPIKGTWREMEARGIFLVGVVAVSPVTDLTLSGSSHERRAEADPYFTRSQAVGYVQAYLWNIDPTDPLAPPSLLS